MTELQKFDHPIHEMTWKDYESLKEKELMKPDTLYLVHEERALGNYTYRALVNGKEIVSITRCYQGMLAMDEERAMEYVLNVIRNGWHLMTGIDGEQWNCVYCTARADGPVVTRYACPCRHV